MRRRTRPDPTPEHLARFVPSEWPGHDPARQWKQACLAWLAADEDRRLPFGEHGDQVDVLREVAAIKRGAVTHPRDRQ